MISVSKKKEDQRQYVVKANDLIRHSRYNLTTQQQKIVLYAISKIKPTDLPENEYEIAIDELCAACGIDLDSGGYYYKAIKEDLVKLTSRLWVQMPDKTETTVAWISDATMMPLSGKVYIKFHPKMAPYLFDLHERYTQYHLEEVLVFRNKYAIRLYEVLRSYTTKKALDHDIEKNVMISLEQLREILSVNIYPRWADFDRFILKRAIEEINNGSEELHIEYETYKNGGRKIETINFIITAPNGKQMLNARARKRERL